VNCHKRKTYGKKRTFSFLIEKAFRTVEEPDKVKRLIRLKPAITSFISKLGKMFSYILLFLQISKIEFE